MTYYSNPYAYGLYPQAAIQQPMIYPQQQMIDNNTTQSQPNNSMDSYFIWVQGEAGAKSYPVARGTTLPLFDTEGDYVYFKSVDANGIPMPLVTKVITDPPFKEKTKVVEEETIETKIDVSNYVTKETYDELKQKYDELENRILELETKPSSSFSSTFTGNTFNNNRKGGQDDGNKFSL